MDSFLKAYFLPTVIVLGLFSGLYLALPAKRPHLPGLSQFPSPFITYWGLSANTTARCVDEQAMIFDSEVLFLPRTSTLQVPPVYAPLSVPLPPMLALDRPFVLSIAPLTTAAWARADEQPLLALLTCFGETSRAPITTPRQPQVWAYGAKPSNFPIQPPVPLQTPAPLTGTLWQPVSYLVHLENGLLIGPPLRESSTPSLETDDALQALVPHFSQLEPMGYYRIHFTP